METEEELNSKILSMTLLIQKKHSELSKFLEEMPITIPNENNPKINIAILQDYYESLSKMLEHSSNTFPLNPVPES